MKAVLANLTGDKWLMASLMYGAGFQTREQGRHHIDESLVQKAVRDAVAKAGLAKRATCHTFRHSFATHLLEGDYDIRTVQKLLDRSDVKTTMIHTHVLNRGPAVCAVRWTDFEPVEEVVLCRSA